MAASYLLDTTAFSDLVVEERSIVTRLTQLLPAGRVLICSIVRGEVLYGLQRMPRGRRRQALTERVEKLFSSLRCEAVPAAAGDHYARIKRQTRAKGLSLDDNDLWIAATAVALEAILLTRDSDFGRIHDLAIETWA